MQVTPVSKVHYRPIEAAIRWLGLLRYESVILAEMGRSTVFPAKLNCPRWSELRARTELLYDAIQNGDLPYGRSGITSNDLDLLDSSELTIRHVDLRKWMVRHFPTQRPAFLFSRSERNIHPIITFEAGQALLVEREALRAELCQYRARLQFLEQRQDALVKKAATIPSCASCPISDRAEKTFLHIIGGLLFLLLGKSPGGKPYSCFKTQEAIVSALEAHFDKFMGMTARTLRGKFAQAKRLIFATDPDSGPM